MGYNLNLMGEDHLSYPIKYIRDNQAAVAGELFLLAQKHAAHDPNLEALPHDTEHYPDQALFPYRIKGSPKSPDEIDYIAGKATADRFPQILDKVAEAEEATGLLKTLGEALDSRQNVMLVTNHGEIADVAIALAGFYSHLKRRGQRASTGIVISRMVSFLGYKIGDETMPATEVLKYLCDDLYLSFPRTDSMSNTKIPKTLVKMYNKDLRYSIGWQLTKGRHLMAVAASGTTDKPLPDDPDTVVLSRLTEGTIELLTKNALVVPTAVWMKDGQLVFEVCDEPKQFKDGNQAHAAMGSIVDALNDKVVGKKFIYQPAQEPNTLENEQ